MVWFGFRGLGNNRSYILNIADILHDPKESENLAIDTIEYDWEAD